MQEISKRGCIWIIEDDPDLRSVMAYLAREEGFDVIELDTLRNSEATLEDAVRFPVAPPGQAPLGILSDFHLPDGDTESFLLRCRSHFAQIPIYCVSGHLLPSAARRLEQAGIQILAKPIGLWQLLGMIAKMKG